MALNINSSTELYGVFGNPVSHSLSPVMHNTAFSVTKHNGIYLAFQVPDIGRAVSGMRALGMKGASVTLPHKIDVMKYLDHIDPMAENIGAVNTIVNRDGQLYGYNTDGLGAVKALEDKTDFQGKNAVIIGAGGAARALGFELTARGARVVITNRTIAKGEKLAEDMGAGFTPLADLHKLWKPGKPGKMGIEILINTTPLGMIPEVTLMPVEESLLDKSMVVMDVVYNPLTTRLLETAEKMGCTTVNGVEMFVRQGLHQFKLWTRKDPPMEVMKKAVLDSLDI